MAYGTLGTSATDTLHAASPHVSSLPCDQHQNLKQLQLNRPAPVASSSPLKPRNATSSPRSKKARCDSGLSKSKASTKPTDSTDSSAVEEDEEMVELRRQMEAEGWSCRPSSPGVGVV